MPTDRAPHLPPYAPPATPPWPSPLAPPAPAPVHRAGLGAALIVALVAAAAGFVEISFWSSRSENGVLVECSYTNLAPWVFGPVAIVSGLVALLRRARPAHGAPAPGPAHLPLALLAIAVGAVHLLTAFGALDLLSQNPC